MHSNSLSHVLHLSSVSRSAMSQRFQIIILLLLLFPAPHLVRPAEDLIYDRDTHHGIGKNLLDFFIYLTPKKKSTKNYTRGGVPLHELLFTLSSFSVYSLCKLRPASFTVSSIVKIWENVNKTFLE